MVQHLTVKQTIFQDDNYQQFKSNWYGRQMTYLASDLLEMGLTPLEIKEAISKAILVCKKSGGEVVQHFQPLYTHHENGIIRDCKLSKTGYGLVLLNANVNNEFVAQWQMVLLQNKVK